MNIFNVVIPQLWQYFKYELSSSKANVVIYIIKIE